MEGGSEQIPLKYEKGARFSIPSFDSVDTNAMGRGTMDPIMSLCVSAKECSLGSKIMIPAMMQDNQYHLHLGQL
jgi:hypothetical protein